MRFPSMCAESARKCAMLMGSASFLTMVGLIGANAQQITQQAAATTPLQASPTVAGQPQSVAQARQAQQVAQTQQPQQVAQAQTAQAQTAQAQTAQAQTAQAQTAQAQTAQAMQAPEQVLVTGSLIHGTAAVGVPVTTFGDGDFKTTGSRTIADLFKNVPAVYQIPQNDV